jgi:hypothetical protein
VSRRIHGGARAQRNGGDGTLAAAQDEREQSARRVRRAFGHARIRNEAHERRAPRQDRRDLFEAALMSFQLTPKRRALRGEVALGALLFDAGFFQRADIGVACDCARSRTARRASLSRAAPGRSASSLTAGSCD